MCAACESDDITRTRDVCAKTRGRPLSVSPFLCRYSPSSIPADRNTSIGAPFSICRSSVFDGVYTMLTTAPYSRSNIGRISLKAGLRLGGAPTDSGSASTGSKVPTMAASPMTAITTLNVRLSTLNLRKSVDAQVTHGSKHRKNLSYTRDGKITGSVGGL